jgi:hypothetical protein
MVVDVEYTERRETRYATEFVEFQAKMLAAVDSLAEESGIARDYWFVTPKNLTITKAGSHVEVAHLDRAMLDETGAQAVQILGPKGSCQPLTECSDSMIRPLCDRTLFICRVYVLVPPGTDIDRDQLYELGRRHCPWPELRQSPLGH